MDRCLAGVMIVALVSVLAASGCQYPSIISPSVALQADLAGGGVLQVGAAAIDINPDSEVHLAGGLPYRLSATLHDPIWARAVVFDNGSRRVAMVSLDLIGLYYDDVVRIRRAIAEQAAVDYVMVASTHTHSAPDVLGAWSPDPFCYLSPYRQRVIDRTAAAVVQAVATLRPATLRVAAGNSGPFQLNRDTRDPDIIDDRFTVWQAIDAETNATLVTSIHYAAHPILVTAILTEVSSDFPHYLRQAIESGVASDNVTVAAQGGLCLFFNGDLGGRISPANGAELVNGPWTEPAYRLAQGYGAIVARRAVELLDSAETVTDPVTITVQSAPIRVPVSNPLLMVGLQLCFLDRAAPENQINSEVAILRVGPMEFFAIPGMIFPELVLGGVGPLAGSDYPDAAIESPPLGQLARQPYPVMVGIANDMLGYLIPASQWDARAPYTTSNNKAPYGEIISAGPEAASIVIDAFATLQPPVSP